MNKFILLVSIYLSSIVACEAQFYFNKYYTRDSGYYYFTSSVILNDHIYVLSQYNEPTTLSNWGLTALLKLDMEGKVISVDTFLPRDTDAFFFQHKLQIVNDSILFFGALDTTNSYGVYYNTVNHSINYSKFQPILGKYFYFYPCAFHVNDIEIFVTSEWNRFRIINGGRYIVADLVLTKMKNGKVIQKKIISEMDETLSLYNIKYNNDGTFYVLGNYSTYIYPIEEKHIFAQNIYHFDTSFNLIKRISSPTEKRFGFARDIVESLNGTKYSVSSEQTFHSTAGGNYLEGDACITKYDSSGKYLWTKTFYNNENYWYDQFNSIILSKDNLSLVAVGNYFSSHHQDSISYDIKKGLIVSISQKGDSLWQRQYIARGSEEYNNINEFLDIKLCPDGGYLLCGSTAINPPPFPDNYSQAGWLMKVDEYGCFIPGCHLVGLKQEANDKMDIKIYPNPAKDFISVIHGHDKILDIDILNLNGVSVKKYKSVNKLETNFLALDNLSSGEYIMNFYERGKLLESKKFLKIE